MTATDRAELRKLAQAATPGPWRCYGDGTHEVYALDSSDADEEPPWVAAEVDSGETAAFIAAANPATVLGLLDRIDELEAGETRTEWRVVCPAHFTTPDRGGSCAMSTSPVERESAALYMLSECQREGHPHARLESRTVTTGRWEVVG